MSSTITVVCSIDLKAPEGKGFITNHMCLLDEDYIKFICSDESQNFFLIRQEAIVPRRNT